MWFIVLKCLFWMLSFKFTKNYFCKSSSVLLPIKSFCNTSTWVHVIMISLSHLVWSMWVFFFNSVISYLTLSFGCDIRVCCMANICWHCLHGCSPCLLPLSRSADIWLHSPSRHTVALNDLKSPEHGLGINMGKNLNYPSKSKLLCNRA